MKRFHVHLHVEDLDRSIGFYSKLFGAEPTRVERGYAKWMIDDPRLNFAISTRGGKTGVDHLGLQTDDADELATLKSRAAAADLALFDEGETRCCYAHSEKHWITDPQGVAWEHFHTLGDIPVFGNGPTADAAGVCCGPTDSTSASASPARDAEPAAGAPVAAGCCGPARSGKPFGIPVAASNACC